MGCAIAAVIFLDAASGDGDAVESQSVEALSALHLLAFLAVLSPSR
jgi:hypothetical protein